VKLSALAEQNFERHIRHNAYPGRGIVAGRSEGGGVLLVYFIMGRSEHSRNRRFVAQGGSLRTEAVDASKVEDASLIIYDAMLELPGAQVVSNGDQTRSIVDELAAGGSFESALARREREPHAPNYTPRISALYDARAGSPSLAMSMLKANAFDPAHTDRFSYRPALPQAGYGLCLTTYAGDGSPLPSFSGEPLILPCRGEPEQVLHTYWDALDEGNRVALAVKSFDERGRTLALHVKNRHP
jgi:hypothetical protein